MHVKMGKKSRGAKPPGPEAKGRSNLPHTYFFLRAACAAANRAMGTR